MFYSAHCGQGQFSRRITEGKEKENGVAQTHAVARAYHNRYSQSTTTASGW